MEDVRDKGSNSSCLWLKISCPLLSGSHWCSSKWYKGVLLSYWWLWEDFHPGQGLCPHQPSQTPKTPGEGLWNPAGPVEEKTRVEHNKRKRRAERNKKMKEDEEDKEEINKQKSTSKIPQVIYVIGLMKPLLKLCWCHIVQMVIMNEKKKTKR